jgi:hypothetical protein
MHSAGKWWIVDAHKRQLAVLRNIKVKDFDDGPIRSRTDRVHVVRLILEK